MFCTASIAIVPIPPASLHLLCLAHFPQMTWDKATNLAAVARGGACSASGEWLILRTHRVMGWGRGGKRLYRNCTWGEGGEKKKKSAPTPHPLHRTTVSCHGHGLFPPVSSLLQPNRFKGTFRARKSHKICGVSCTVVLQRINKLTAQ